MKTARVAKLCEKMRERSVDLAVISSKENLYYFTGAYLDPMERLLALVIHSDGSSQYFVNRLFFVDPSVQTELIFWDDTEDPVAMMAKVIPDGANVVIDQDWPARFLLGLMEAQPNARYRNMPELVNQLRAVKDAEEIELMTRSSRINDRVMEQLLAQVDGQITEEKLANLRYELFAQEGANAYGTCCIFSYGAHCAEPHHVSDATLPRPGDSVMIDMGAPYQHYASDMTRTVFYREVSPEMEKIYNIVLRAHHEAAKAIRAGVPCCTIDRIARDIITQEGYGAYFTHRTGHGIGLTPHEFPDISSKCDAPLQAGMIHSVEPGIYLPGVGGVRIENLYVVTETGADPLNQLPLDLMVV
ncbi:MAG: Xaa-Pro peptidase family protein [Slackia sp.]|nr:Xaa-Pro peptidase family protein [Slackia sp.]